MNDVPREWFERRTFAASAFTHERLTAAKGATTVTVVIPAKDEAQTIGSIVRTINDEHVHGTKLVDELIVMDSDSVDDTAAVAASAGARVFTVAEIRPDLGWRPGKGEAMWKSLFVSSGDIVVFIDADLTNFTPEYIPGLLGPLLTDHDVELVKAFYDRDLVGTPNGISQGGRVTELTARPLLNLWWPDLTHLVQPLAGEWAARRSLLETLSFPSGYGIELAAVVDTYEQRGLDAIAQVDLGVRDHVHQDLNSLGVLAAEVVAAAALRKFGEDPQHPELAQLRTMTDGDTKQWTMHSVNCEERPPAAFTPADPEQ